MSLLAGEDEADSDHYLNIVRVLNQHDIVSDLCLWRLVFEKGALRMYFLEESLVWKSLAHEILEKNETS